MNDRNIFIDDQENSFKTIYGRIRHTTKDPERAAYFIWSGQLSLKKASFHFNITKGTLCIKLRWKTIESKCMGHCLYCFLKNQNCLNIE